MWQPLVEKVLVDGGRIFFASSGNHMLLPSCCRAGRKCDCECVIAPNGISPAPEMSFIFIIAALQRKEDPGQKLQCNKWDEISSRCKAFTAIHGQ